MDTRFVPETSGFCVFCRAWRGFRQSGGRACAVRTGRVFVVAGVSDFLLLGFHRPAMDPSTLFRVAPTFPIDDDRIQVRRRTKIVYSPWTLGSVAAATLLGIVAHAGVPGFIALYALAAIGLRWFWEGDAPISMRRASVN